MLKDAHTHIDPLTGNESTLRIGDYYRFLNKKSKETYLYEFLGWFNSISEVPPKSGFFLINGEDKYFMKELDLEAYNAAMEKAAVEKLKAMKAKSSNLLDCSVNPRDDELKIMVKRLLKGKTHEDFKNLFNDVTVSNNMKGAIFGDKDLSWKRFTEMCRLLGCTYNIEIVQGDRIVRNLEEE